MNTNLVNEIVPKMTGSAVGAVGAWGLQEVSVIAAILSSVVSMSLGILGMIHLLKHWGKK
tara:strand:+ start:167 stop:346 length:180 start_codon:yes stop_codon:yes gene_type:complete